MTIFKRRFLEHSYSTWLDGMSMYLQETLSPTDNLAPCHHRELHLKGNKISAAQSQGAKIRGAWNCTHHCILDRWWFPHGLQGHPHVGCTAVIQLWSDQALSDLWASSPSPGMCANGQGPLDLPNCASALQENATPMNNIDCNRSQRKEENTAKKCPLVPNPKPGPDRYYCGMCVYVVRENPAESYKSMI